MTGRASEHLQPVALPNSIGPAQVTGRSANSNLVFDKLVWTVEDLARELSISVRHVYKLTSEGRIPYSKVGRVVRFSPVKIIEWLQKGGTR